MHNLFQSIPSPADNFFPLGPFQIHYYALCILLGIVLAVTLASFRLKSRGAEPGIALDVAIWAVPLGIVGARVFHVLTHWNDYFTKPGVDPLSALYVWEGGIAIYGGLLGGTVGAWIAARTNGIRFLALADIFAPGLILAQGVGRWGNYFNSELFGVPTDLPWGLEIGTANPAYPAGLPDGVLFHPTFLYESIWDIAGVFVILYLEKKFKLSWGRVFAAYLIYYSTGRAFIESIRIDPSEIILGLRTNVWSAIFGIIIGLVLLIWSSRRHVGAEVSIFLPGRKTMQEAKATPKKSKVEKSGDDFELDASKVKSRVSKKD